MAGDVTNELLLEHLKAIQATLARHDREFREIKERLGILETQVAGLGSQYASLSNRLDHVALRIERIETRLGLVDV